MALLENRPASARAFLDRVIARGPFEGYYKYLSSIYYFSAGDREKASTYLEAAPLNGMVFFPKCFARIVNTMLKKEKKPDHFRYYLFALNELKAGHTYSCGYYLKYYMFLADEKCRWYKTARELRNKC